MRPIDKTLLVVLGPLWAVSFLLAVKAAVRPAAFPSPLFVSVPASEQEYPTLLAFLRGSPGLDSGLRVGDRLLRLNDVDLRGVSPLGFFVRFVDTATAAQGAMVTYERAGARGQAWLACGTTAILRPLLLASALFAGAAFLLLVRARPSPVVSAFFQLFMCVALNFSANFYGRPLQSYAAVALHGLTMMLIGPLTLRALLLFPSAVGPTTVLERFGPWGFAVLGPLHTTRFGFPGWLSPQLAVPAVVVGVVLFLATTLAVTTRTYRRADAIGRRQLKWFLFGVYCGAVPPLFAAVLAAIDERFTPIYLISLTALGCIPLSLLISVARYNLFDIDRLISATVSYNVVLIVLVAAVLAVVPRVAQALAQGLNLDPTVGQIALSGLLAAFVVPVHRRLRPRIESVFFVERHAFDVGIGDLMNELAQSPDPQALTELLGQRLHDLLRPESCVLYGHTDGSYAPLIIKGRAAVPAFAADAPLITALRQRRGPLAFEGIARHAAGPMSPFDHAVLETLEAAVVIPCWRGDALSLILCLGPKRSGDVYTPTDIRLLAMLADKVSSQLVHFDQAEMIRQSRRMQDALRRYVLGAVADRLATGQDLEPAERDVSVLFVDIRGFTRYCQDRPPGEIFSTVSQYTETVSRVAHRHGGSVVEFTGDGVMVVFGAPCALPAKEEAAVQTGHEMFDAVKELAAAGADASRFAIGVGIATGRAFVGNIRSADRLIWSTIGDTPNTGCTPASPDA